MVVNMNLVDKVMTVLNYMAYMYWLQHLSFEYISMLMMDIHQHIHDNILLEIYIIYHMLLNPMH